MRTVSYSAACSLDLYIAGPDGGIDWLLWSDDVTAVMADFWKDVDTILTGRKSYEAVLRMGGGGGSMPGVKGYVCSRTMQNPPDPHTPLVADAVAFVRELKQQPGKGICIMGGGELARSLLDAGLIDKVGLNIHPLLLGSGVPMFPGPFRQTRLELVGSRTLQKGCVHVSYRVNPSN